MNTNKLNLARIWKKVGGKTAQEVLAKFGPRPQKPGPSFKERAYF